jgi:hypothetical protein
LHYPDLGSEFPAELAFDRSDIRIRFFLLLSGPHWPCVNALLHQTFSGPYREILFNYFSREPTLNIDMFCAQEGPGMAGR